MRNRRSTHDHDQIPPTDDNRAGARLHRSEVPQTPSRPHSSLLDPRRAPWRQVEGHKVGQTVRAEYQIFSPLFLRIAEKSFLESEIQEENLDEDIREKIENNIRNAIGS